MISLDESCGIYMIRCRPTGEYYIGATKRVFRKHFAERRSHLRCGRCSCRRLQAAADKYGVEAFEFRVLKLFPPEELAEKERVAIAALKPALNEALHEQRAVPNERMSTVVIGGEEMTVAQAARRFDVGYQTIRTRYIRGLRGDDLITTPYDGTIRRPSKGWYSKPRAP